MTRTRSAAGDTGAIVLDHDREPAWRLARAVEPRTDQDAVAAPLAGVVEYVADQLEDVAGIAQEAERRGHVQVDAQILAGVHLQQCRAQVGHQGQYRNAGLSERCPAAGRGAFELVIDDLRNPVDLVLQRRALRDRVFTGAELRANHGQRRLQAVRQVAERVAIARDTIALRLEQRIEAIGNTAELAWIIAAQGGRAARLHRRDFLLQAPHRR